MSDSPAAARPLGGNLAIRTIRLPAGLKPAVLPFDDARARAGEQYRSIRTKIVQHPYQARMIVVTSPAAGDGKTLSKVNIAGALALLKDVNVLLVDGDLRYSGVSATLQIPAAPGLADVLGGACPLDRALVRVEQLANLCVLPAGRVLSNPTELLDSQQWRDLCARFREEFKYTIVDAPPFGSIADYDLLQDLSDGIILVVRPDHTDRALCFHALEAAPKSKLLGTVVNCVEDWFLWKTRDAYYGSAGSESARSGM